jgi:hypothetical protein
MLPERTFVLMLTGEMEEIFGGYFFVEEEPEAAAARLAEIIEERRLAL